MLLYKLSLFLVSIFVIVQMFPKMPRFAYDYQQGSPWKYEDLIAPVDFAILKAPSDIEQEEEQIVREFIPFFLKSNESSQ